MDEDWHIHITNKLEKRSCARRIKIFPVDTRIDHDTLQLVLLHSFFRFLKNLIIVERHGASKAEQSLRMLRRQLRGMFVEFFDHAKSIGPIRRADPIVAKHSDVDTGFILFLEQAVQIENRPRRLRMVPTLGHKVSVTIDDHEQFPPKSDIRGRRVECQISNLASAASPSLEVSALIMLIR